jgi:hypothetical protein
VADHIAVAGLILDVCGALLLGRAAIFERAKDYVKGRGTPKWDYDAQADAVRATDAVDARVGAGLLAIGFVGQGVSAAGATIGPAVAYTAMAVVLALATAAWHRGRPRFEREMLRARIQSIEDHGYGLLVYENGESVIDQYARSMRRRPRASDETLYQYAEAVFGPTVWSSMDWASERAHPELSRSQPDRRRAGSAAHSATARFPSESGVDTSHSPLRG